MYDPLAQEIALYRKAHPQRPAYGRVMFLDASCEEPDSPWVESLTPLGKIMAY